MVELSELAVEPPKDWTAEFLTPKNSLVAGAVGWMCKNCAKPWCVKCGASVLCLICQGGDYVHLCADCAKSRLHKCVRCNGKAEPFKMSIRPFMCVNAVLCSKCRKAFKNKCYSCGTRLPSKCGFVIHDFLKKGTKIYLMKGKSGRIKKLAQNALQVYSWRRTIFPQFPKSSH
ncbi:MAG: hypothetical protein HY394_01920 [Candidatus Diapherotrites archaeon]|nr:hypothetical protein [Candidatus Diapherotrites archaeon]